MKTNIAGPAADAALERRLRERLLLAPRPAGDRLLLADATLLAALDGSRPLTAGERAALQGSPLTARRLRQLALARRADANADANADADAEVGRGGWRASQGRLRAASSGAIDTLRTDDGWFTLHLIEQDGAWRSVLQLAPEAPFAAALLAARAPLRVRDGAGRTILEGRLDADGECEAAWPFAAAPASHLQAAGAAFSVDFSADALPG